MTQELSPEITETTIIKKEQEEKPDSDRESIRLVSELLKKPFQNNFYKHMFNY